MASDPKSDSGVFVGDGPGFQNMVGSRFGFQDLARSEDQGLKSF